MLGQRFFSLSSSITITSGIHHLFFLLYQPRILSQLALHVLSLCLGL